SAHGAPPTDRQRKESADRSLFDPFSVRERFSAASVYAGMKRLLLVSLLSLSAACGAPDQASPQPPDSGFGPALTYTELFAQFFAPGTPGHCATAGCHADPGHNVWLCGTTKDSCYNGMVQVGLVDPAHPPASMIVDPTLSPLTWIDPTGGNMPYDAM